MKSEIKRSKSDLAVTIIFFVVLLLYVLSIVLVLGWGLLTSFKSRVEFTGVKNILGVPTLKYSAEELKFGNYIKIFTALNFDKYTIFLSNGVEIEHSVHATFATLLANTFLYAVVGSLLEAFVPCICAYLCAKFKFKFGAFIYGLVLAVRIIPIIGSYPAEITLLRDLRLYDTFIGYFCQKFTFTGMYFFVYYAFFEGLPDTYSEAAEIDGGSRLRILVSIIIPLSIKMITTVWLLQFVTMWNDYQTPLLYMPTKPTLAYGIYNLCHETAKGALANVPAKVAGCMILALPLLIFFVIFKDKLMGNISMGGIKE